MTTGKSTKEVLDVLRRSGAVPVVCGSIVDRRALAVGGVDGRDLAVGGTGRPAEVDGVPYRALLALEVPAWEPAACPLCARGGAASSRPGSRHLAATA